MAAKNRRHRARTPAAKPVGRRGGEPSARPLAGAEAPMPDVVESAQTVPDAPGVSATRPSRGARSRLASQAVEPTRWSRVALLVLLGLVLVVQMIIGAITHVVAHRNRLLVVDLFFFQAPFVLPACVVLMPAAKLLTHQPRYLRLLEALSLGALYALFALLLTSVFVHPTVAGTVTADQLIDSLRSTDAAGIAVADLLALAACVQIFPALSRLLSAPGRRARERMLARNAASRNPGPTAASGDARGNKRTGGSRRSGSR